MPARSSHISLSTHVQSTKAPWTTLLVLKAGQRVESLVAAPQGFVVKVLKGGKCRTRGTLFLEFARVLDFPDYFGHNWDALEECLADFEWLPAKGYVLLLTDAEQILRDDEEEYETFLEVLSDAGEAWGSGQAGLGSKRATPFHVVMAVAEKDRSKRSHWGVQEISSQRSKGSGPIPSARQASAHRRSDRSS